MKRTIYAAALLLASILNVNAEGVNIAVSILENGTPLLSAPATVRLSLVTDTPDGDAVYMETHNTTTNAQGVAHLVLGEGTSMGQNWDDVVWGRDRMYLKVEKATSDGYTLVNCTRIGAVPYAYHARTAENVTLTSANGTAWAVGVDESGNLTTTPVATNPSEGPAYGTVDYIFDETALPTVTLEISTAEWNQLLANYDANPNNETCIHADFYFNKNGVVHSVTDMGLRLRGNTSRRRPEGEPGDMHSPNGLLRQVHWGFRFQKFTEDDAHLFSGTDRFSLRWAKEDPTHCHEIYGYDLMRRFGVYTTARSSYCRLYIKIKEDAEPVYYGVHEMFEAYDDQWIADHTDCGDFTGKKGYLWKGTWDSGVGADFSSAETWTMGVSDDTHGYSYDLKSKKKELEQATARLVDFITQINSLSGDAFKTWAEENIDTDLLLRAMACEWAIGHWDNFMCNGNNYYIYFDNAGTGKMKYCPYDLDNTLGTSGGFDAATQYPTDGGTSPLSRKMLSIPEYKAKFIDYIDELCSPANDYIDPTKSAVRINRWHDLIRPHIGNDLHEDDYIADRPASWSSTSHYRLLDTGNNFFSAKISSKPSH